MQIATAIARQTRSPRRLNRRTLLIGFAAAAALVTAGLTGLGAAAGFFDRDPVHLYGVDPARPARAVAVYFSSDMGLRLGMGAYVAPALAAHGLPVYGISSPAVFNRRRTQADVDTLLADSVRDALARSGAGRVVLMGQSFGSDVLVSALGSLPPELRARVAAIVLVVPARTIYFRADPLGLHYLGTPDADGDAAIKGMTWAPVVCIYGQSETDSLCPALLDKPGTVIELPGGHFLDNDRARLVTTILDALEPIFRQSRETHA